MVSATKSVTEGMNQFARIFGGEGSASHPAGAWNSINRLAEAGLIGGAGAASSIAGVVGLQDALNERVLLSQLSIGLVPMLQTVLDSKAAATHAHDIANVTGLAAALAGKGNQPAAKVTGAVTRYVVQDPTTGQLFYADPPEIPVIPADVFLDNSSFNTATNVLTLHLSDNTTFEVDLATLIQISSTGVLTGKGTATDPLALALAAASYLTTTGGKLGVDVSRDADWANDLLKLAPRADIETRFGIGVSGAAFDGASNVLNMARINGGTIPVSLAALGKNLTTVEATDATNEVFGRTSGKQLKAAIDTHVTSHTVESLTDPANPEYPFPHLIRGTHLQQVLNARIRGDFYALADGDAPKFATDTNRTRPALVANGATVNVADIKVDQRFRITVAPGESCTVANVLYSNTSDIRESYEFRGTGAGTVERVSAPQQQQTGTLQTVPMLIVSGGVAPSQAGWSTVAYPIPTVATPRTKLIGGMAFDGSTATVPKSGVYSISASYLGGGVLAKRVMRNLGLPDEEMLIWNLQSGGASGDVALDAGDTLTFQVNTPNSPAAPSRFGVVFNPDVVGNSSTVRTEAQLAAMSPAEIAALPDGALFITKDA